MLICASRYAAWRSSERNVSGHLSKPSYRRAPTSVRYFSRSGARTHFGRVSNYPAASSTVGNGARSVRASSSLPSSRSANADGDMAQGPRT